MQSINLKRIRKGSRRRVRADGSSYEVSHCGLVSLSSGSFVQDGSLAILERMRAGDSRVFDGAGNELSLSDMESFFSSMGFERLS